MSLQTSIPAIFLHALIFAFVYSAVSHCYWKYVKQTREKKWGQMVMAMERDIANEQINQMYLNQFEQTEVLKQLASKCSSEKVVKENGPGTKYSF